MGVASSVATVNRPTNLTLDDIDALSPDDLDDLRYPVGSRVATVNATSAGPLSGATMPEQGASGGSFLAFADNQTESAVFSLGEAIQSDTVRTVDLYLEVFSFSGTGNVRWQVNVNSGGNATTDQTIVVAGDGKQTPFKVGGQTYTLQSNTIAGTVKYGATVVVSRITTGNTYSGDIYLASLHAIRVT